MRSVTGEELKAAKERLGWSTRRIAIELRLSERTVWRYLSKTGTVPGPVERVVDIHIQALTLRTDRNNPALIA